MRRKILYPQRKRRRILAKIWKNLILRVVSLAVLLPPMMNLPNLGYYHFLLNLSYTSPHKHFDISYNSKFYLLVEDSISSFIHLLIGRVLYSLCFPVVFQNLDQLP